MVIACDFDGTITDKNIFPNIGEFKEHALDAIKNFQNHGHKVIMWTCREGIYLDDAKIALHRKGVFLDGYNYSPFIQKLKMLLHGKILHCQK